MWTGMQEENVDDSGSRMVPKLSPISSQMSIWLVCLVRSCPFNLEPVATEVSLVWGIPEEFGSCHSLQKRSPCSLWPFLPTPGCFALIFLECPEFPFVLSLHFMVCITTLWASQVVQLYRICLPMQEIPRSGRSPGGRNGYPLQYFCLENPMDGGAWHFTVHGVAMRQTRLSTHTCMHHPLPFLLCWPRTMLKRACKMLVFFKEFAFSKGYSFETWGESLCTWIPLASWTSSFSFFFFFPYSLLSSPVPLVTKISFFSFPWIKRCTISWILSAFVSLLCLSGSGS